MRLRGVGVGQKAFLCGDGTLLRALYGHFSAMVVRLQLQDTMYNDTAVAERGQHGEHWPRRHAHAPWARVHTRRAALRCDCRTYDVKFVFCTTHCLF